MMGSEKIIFGELLRALATTGFIFPAQGSVLVTLGSRHLLKGSGTGTVILSLLLRMAVV